MIFCRLEPGICALELTRLAQLTGKGRLDADGRGVSLGSSDALGTVTPRLLTAAMAGLAKSSARFEGVLD